MVDQHKMVENCEEEWKLYIYKSLQLKKTNKLSMAKMYIQPSKTPD